MRTSSAVMRDCTGCGRGASSSFQKERACGAGVAAAAASTSAMAIILHGLERRLRRV